MNVIVMYHKHTKEKPTLFHLNSGVVTMTDITGSKAGLILSERDSGVVQ